MKEISIFDIPGFEIGHAQDETKGTGVSVILCKEGANAGVDVRGGGPATRETDLLDPKNMVQKIHAITLSGGSAFGLEASSGVMQYLSEHKIGFNLGDITIPIVCQASLFDCMVADSKAFPDKQMGYQACLNANQKDTSQGNIGAGMGATVGKVMGLEHMMKSGLGHFAYQIGDLMVGAIVACNACGDVYQPNSKDFVAGLYDFEKHVPLNTEDFILSMQERKTSPHENTTIGCILTNANLDKAQMNKLASLTHNAYAHTIHPVHTSNDGDTIFTMSTNTVDVDVDTVGILAIRAMEQAIVNSVKCAKSIYNIKSWEDIQCQY